MDELDLRASIPWLRMGTGSLKDEPWLVVDAKRDAELALRAELIDERRAAVIAEPPESRAAADELLAMVETEGFEVSGSAVQLPLERLGRSVQEDLCLLQRGADEWELAAAVLCFPSRWRLADKIGRPLTEVHGPVEGYDPALRHRITNLLDRLGTQTVRRRNWFVHPDGALFQPTRPDLEPVIPAARCRDELFVRSERQTLRVLPRSEWIVFTIRIQQATLGEFMSSAERASTFVAFLAEADAADIRHRGISGEQANELAAMDSAP